MPHISVSLGQTGELLSYDVAADLAIIDLKSFINAETGVPIEQQVIYLNGQPLMNDAQTIQAAGIVDNDMLAAEIRAPQQQRQQQADRTAQGSRLLSQPRQPSQEDLNASIETMRQGLIADGAFQHDANVRGAPELANSVNDPVRFRNAFLEFQRAQVERQAQRIASLNGDLTEENQAEIEEAIRRENIEVERLETIEENPECELHNGMFYAWPSS